MVFALCGTLFFQLLLLQICSSSFCPEISNCICPEVKNRHVKLKCSRIQSIDQSTFLKIVNSSSINQLDLSNNTIRELQPNAFPIRGLSKLNLDRNFIERIEDGAFSNLNTLKKLILSNNKLKELRKNMFSGLNSVDSLKVNYNLLTNINNDTFDLLPSLKQLDISGNPLLCSCDLWWLQHASFKLTSVPKCAISSTLPDQPSHIDSFLLGLECDKGNKLDYALSISPEQDQVTFEGDSLMLVCKFDGVGMSNAPDPLVLWEWNGKNPSIMFDDTSYIYQKDFNDNDTLTSVLMISDLYEKHSGEWSCSSVMSKFNQTSSVNVKVLSKNSVFCKVTTTETDKGYYVWPESISGHIVEQPCEVSDNLTSDFTNLNTASYYCESNGSWFDLHTDNCPYTSSVTRILLQFSKMNLTNDTGSLIESAIRLHNFTVGNLKNINNVKDIHFLLSTIENYIEYLDSEPKIGSYLVQIMSSIVQLPGNLLEKAQQQHVVCSRFIDDIHLIINYSPRLDFQNNEFAIREIPVTSDTVSGLICSMIRNSDNLFLNCSTINKTLPKGWIFDASVLIPTNLLRYLETKIIRLFVSSFKDSRLFPDRNNNKESSSVIAANIISAKIPKLDEPLIITLNNDHFSVLPTLGWWDADASLWIRDVCQLSSDPRAPFLKFTCDRFGYFSLMTNKHDNGQTTNRNVQKIPLFNFLHPSVYVGTFICVTCLLLAVATYCYCYSRIQMSKKMKHSLTNTWLSASLLFLIFSIEIHQTDHELLCQVIGLSIHYFALSTLFWMAVTIKALYKRVQKSNPSVSTPSEDIPGDIPIEKPILGIYLVGWGISAILCGIAGAVNIRGYAGVNFCFLSPGPALSTLLIPGSLVLFYLIIMCLLVKCAAGGVDSNPQLSVGTQAIDLELLDGGGVGNGGRSSYLNEGCNSVRSFTTPSSQAEDTEHSPIRQLKAFVIFLIFYLSATICAAACVMMPLQWPPYEEKLFSFMYATICVLLGAFVLFFHCFARNDVRSAWSYILSGKKLRRKSPHIIMNGFMPTAQLPQVTNAAYGGVEYLLPANNLIMSAVAPTLDSNSARSNFLKQMPNINLVRLHRQHYRGCSTLMADGNFYNPHQSIAAKKFFKKQRKKRLGYSLQVRRCRSGGSSPVSHAFLFDDRVAVRAVPPGNNGNVTTEFERVAMEAYLMRPHAYNSRYDELSSEKHPLTYDEPDMTAGEEGKTGTESEATFTVPEYAEIPEPNMPRYDDMVVMNGRVPEEATRYSINNRNWCSSDAVSDVNSEPTYNYAYIRNGYLSSRSAISDNSSGNSHLYTSVVPDVVRSVDRFGNKHRSAGQSFRMKPTRDRQAKMRYKASTNHHKEHEDASDSRRRHKEEGYKQLRKDPYMGLSPSSDFSSEDKVETCV